MTWTCPSCRRQFGRRNQSHECAPAMSLDDYFASGPAFERPIFEAVLEHLRDLEPLHVEAVSVGIFFKRARTFAELRPKRDRVVLSRRLLKHPRIIKTVRGTGERAAYFIDLRSPADVDDQVRDWLTEAYLASPL
jgi:putative ubiquitin-RnfH superfamily antitoxin RatB of RatAB toxin-antitoxin module